MSDILDEVKEEVRQEKMDKIWAEYGRLFLICGIIAVILTGANSAYNHWETNKNSEQTAQLTNALMVKDFDKLSELSASFDKKHAILAKFNLAGNSLDQDKIDESIAIYKEIEAMRTKSNAVYTDLALLQRLTLQIDTGDVSLLRADLNKLLNDQNTWQYMALELSALLYAREDKYDVAITELKKISDARLVSPALKGRASSLIMYFSRNINETDDK